MFKKLKDKIAEEVKSSPQRFQQLTQSVSEKFKTQPATRVSSQSVTMVPPKIDPKTMLTNQKRILDARSSSPNPEPGFSNVSLSTYSTPNSGYQRRNSNSSIASDMSFLPRYESATNLYHLQSDLDVSASEVEDNASTSSQLGHLSKEQIYAAFQKAQTRYHKYRGRFTDIANHYKELERENGKMKSVLVETQDKALRRVAELREQCALEQKAKAHLENALRVELDEKQYVIDTLKTKVGLLQISSKNDNADPVELLINISDNSNRTNDDANKLNKVELEMLTKDLKDARIEIENLNAKLQEMKANTIIFHSKESDFKKKIIELEESNKHKSEELTKVLENERENNLLMAQTKMELHTEIQNRDLEIENLKHDIEALKADLDSYESSARSTKMENLQSQNTKLIEKVEELTQRCQNYESDSLKNLSKTIQACKMEIEVLNNEKQELQSQSHKANDLQIKNEELLNELSSLERIKEENTQLQLEIQALKADFEKNILIYREDTKQQLFTLEAKIRHKITEEYKEKERVLTIEFEEKLQELSQSDASIQELQLKLIAEEKYSNSLKLKVNELEELLHKEKEKYADLETNHLDLITESTETRSQLKSAQQQCENLEEHLSKEKCLVELLQKSHSQLEEEFQKLETDYVCLQNQNVDLNKILEEKAQMSLIVENLQIEIQNLQQFKAASTNLQKELNILQNELSVLKDTNIQFHEEKSKSEDLIIQVTHDKLKLQEQNNHLLSHTEKLNIDNLQLQQSLKEASDNNSNLSEHLQKLTETNENLHSEIQQKQSDLIAIQQTNKNYENQLQESSKDTEKQLEASNELKEIKQNLENSQKALETSKQGYQKELKEQKTKFHSEIQSLHNEISSFKDKNSDIKTLIEDYKQKLNEYESNSSEKNRQLDELLDENSNIKEELEKYKETIKITKIENEKLAEDLRILNDDLLHKSGRLEEITINLQRIEESKDNLSRQLQNSIDESNNLRAKLSTIENDAAANLTDSNTFKKEIVDLENVNLELREQISKHREMEENQKLSLKILEDQRNDLNEEKSQLISHNTQLEKQILDINLKNNELQTVINQLEGNLNDHLNKNNTLEDNYSRIVEEVEELKRRNKELSLDYKQITQENEGLLQESVENKLKFETINSEKIQWEVERSKLFEQLEEHKLQLNKFANETANIEDQVDKEVLLNENKNVKLQLSSFEQQIETFSKEKKHLENQLQELENQFTELTHERQLLLDEIQELKTAPLNINNSSSNAQKLDNLDIVNTEKNYSLQNSSDVQRLQEDHEKEINHLNEKLVQYKSLDLTNRSSIQFYENEMQKLTNKNEKLNRKLDETLVTLNHCTELSNSTETEYLRNVLYNYMLGKESVVLARVIAAVCKFDDRQTDTILQREQQKQTLLGQLGFI